MTEIDLYVGRPVPNEFFYGFDRAVDRLQRRFAELWGDDSAPTFRAARTDIVDTGSAYRITAEIPGIPKENLSIQVNGTQVEIRGEAATRAETPEGEYLYRERSYAGFYRALDLPEPVKGAEAKAQVREGVLLLEIPKEKPTPAPAAVKVPVE